MKRLNLYTVNKKYCKFLREYDDRVPLVSGEKAKRPFIGILICVNRKNYFAPLTSPKKKHLTMKEGQDFIKIKQGKLGAINLNNMIPIPFSELRKIDINNIEDEKYRKLLMEQISWCNTSRNKIMRRAYSLYRNFKYDNLTEKLKARCCDFDLLEEMCHIYMNENSLAEEELIYTYTHDIK